MESIVQNQTQASEDSKVLQQQHKEEVARFKKRMLEWSNPVEYVNNMYGCHPGDDDDDYEYFRKVFAK